MKTGKTSIIFFGTPDFSVLSLEALAKAEFCDIRAVITQPDKPVGRHHSTPIPSPIKQAAQALKLPVLEGLDGLKGIEADLGVVVAYGAILPQWLLDHFPLGIVNIHPSLLPKYRGSSPIQAVILNRDPETGVTLMKLDNQMDHGPIIAQEMVSLRAKPAGEAKQSYNRNKDGLSDDLLQHVDRIASVVSTLPRNDKMTAGELHNCLAQIGAEMLIKYLPDYIAGKINPVPQEDDKATYTKKLTKEDGKIDWKKSPEEIEARVRAMNPWPGAWTIWQGKRLIIWKMSPNGKLEEVQSEGKKKMPLEEFLKGHPGFDISQLLAA